MPEEPNNNNPEQPIEVGGNDQLNNFNNEAPVSMPDIEVMTETTSAEPSIDEPTVAVDQAFNQEFSSEASNPTEAPTFGETPTFSEASAFGEVPTPEEPVDSPTSPETFNTPEASSQPANDFATNPVVDEEPAPTNAPVMTPESLPVQSTGGEPAIPPQPEQPQKNKFAIPILIVGILVIVFVVAGYFLAKYLF